MIPSARYIRTLVWLWLPGCLVLNSLFAQSTLANQIGPNKLNTAQQKDVLHQPSNSDLHTNTIAGSSDYVPELDPKNSTTSTTVPSILPMTQASNTTQSQANVFQATAAQPNTKSLSSTVSADKDPLVGNAQSQNPFLSNVPGGINPQIALLLRSNPRLQMLARQNPIIAQQIMRNPALLRDPMIQRAIQSQLSPGQGQNILGQLGNIGLLNGLGRALNPLGIGTNPLTQNNQRGALNNNNQNQNYANFGVPRNQQQQQQQQQQAITPKSQHQEDLPGGYYGNNDNYSNQPAQNENEVGGGEDEENSGDSGNQDYEDQGGDENSAGDDSQQNPAEDPDIQQLQNFGGPVNDNFPEGLFPPGLLTKEDIEEIRRQQEKQQQEAEERERQQQQQGDDNQSADYEDTGEEGANGGEEGTEGVNEPEQGTVDEQHNGGNQQSGNEPYNQGNIGQQGYQAPISPAYHNAYQPVQPQRVPMQPAINYANGQHNQQQQNYVQPQNQFNYQPNVEYDQEQEVNNYRRKTSTFPVSRPKINAFNGGQSQYPSRYQPNVETNVESPYSNQFRMNRPHNRQPLRSWNPRPVYGTNHPQENDIVNDEQEDDGSDNQFNSPTPSYNFDGYSQRQQPFRQRVQPYRF